MRVVIQRVASAQVFINEQMHAQIGKGLLILLGIEHNDNEEDVDWLCKKIVNLRIFPDHQNVMNLSVMDIDGEVMVVSQFTLHASTRKGNRPSYIRAAHPDVAIPLYEQFLRTLQNLTGKSIASGVFGAMMKVSLMNDGPVTIIIDSKLRE